MPDILRRGALFAFDCAQMSVQWNPAQLRFELETSGELAVADCVASPKKWVVTHVVVPVAARGGGVASQLALGIVEHARREGGTIVPVCPFMATYFERHPEARDVLSKE